MTALTHNYNGYTISQESDGYTSLTDMAKAAGKLVADYLKTDSSQAYFQGLSDDMNIPISSLIRIVQGKGKNQGTWAHPEIAIDFAKWCNVSFRIWANRTLRGVIEGTATQPRPAHDLAIRKLDLKIEIAKLELEKLELQREYYAPLPHSPAIPIQQELALDLDIEQRFKASQAALLKSKALENEYKAQQLEQKYAPKINSKLSGIENTESVEAYMRERVKFNPNAKTHIGNANGDSTKLLYPNYLQYCSQNNLAFVAMQSFSKVLMHFAYTSLEVRLSKGRDRDGCFLRGVSF